MNILTFAVPVTVFALSLLPATAALEVHEWGTFTVVQGSDGTLLDWYQASADTPELPAFTAKGAPGIFLKARNWQMARLRMETPVIYFYPDQPMKIEVRAELAGGEITELFPPGRPLQPDEPFPNSVRWTGALLRPDSADLALVPAAPGESGRHYAAARAVPDAWLFRGDDPVPVPVPVPRVPGEDAGDAAPVSTVTPVDHFIFYRGAGRQTGPAVFVKETGPLSWQITNGTKARIPALVGVRVAGDRISWQALPALAARNPEAEEWPSLTLAFPEAGAAAETAVPELRGFMLATLERHGLTRAEAAAMVATWDELWFTEPGTRIFSILPREWVDDLVPLTICPVPEKLIRVFVQRTELLESRCEFALANILSDTSLTTESAAVQLAALELGRFRSAAVNRAATVQTGLMLERYQALAAENP